jgi:hypothetical protein
VSTNLETPREMVTGVLDDPGRLGSVLDALRAAGVPDDAVQSTAGEEALDRVDPDGRRHGARGRLTRMLEHFGQEGDEHHAAAEEVEAGHALVAVRVHDQAEADRAAGVLREQGVRRLRRWGRWGIEQLS